MKLRARLFGGIVLRTAIRSGDLKTVLEVLLATPGLITKRYKRGATLLHWAAAYGQPQVVELLLQNNAPLNAADDAGFLPLHLSATAEVAKALIEAGADVSAMDFKGNTALGAAAEYNRPDVAEVLLDHGAVVDATNSAGGTPLVYCAIHGHAETAQVLLERGANPTARTPQGMTALQVAEAKQDQQMLKLFARS